MIFYKHFIGDYQRDTGHLSILEHGAYRLLMDTCYATEKPLPADERRIFRLLRATEPDEHEAIRTVLAEFWELGPDGWTNKRATEEIAAQNERSEKARRSARIRHGKDERTASAPANACADASETHDRDGGERSASHSQTPEAKPEPQPEDPPHSPPQGGGAECVDESGRGRKKGAKPPTEDQRAYIRALCRQRDIPVPDVATKREATELISDLEAGKTPERPAPAAVVPVEPHPSHFGRCGRCKAGPVKRNAMGLCQSCEDWMANEGNGARTEDVAPLLNEAKAATA